MLVIKESSFNLSRVSVDLICMYILHLEPGSGLTLPYAAFENLHFDLYTTPLSRCTHMAHIYRDIIFLRVYTCIFELIVLHAHEWMHALIRTRYPFCRCISIQQQLRQQYCRCASPLSHIRHVNLFLVSCLICAAKQFFFFFSPICKWFGLLIKKVKGLDLDTFKVSLWGM